MEKLGTQKVPTAACTSDIVGNAFVHQYYHILHQSPQLLHRFYQEISKLGRPEENGIMRTTSTLQAIDKKILELGYGVIKAEIATVDIQESYGGGVNLLVTGYLTVKDCVRRTFTQTFFLAPQETGYFVLNDMFRFIDETAIAHGNKVLANNIQVPVNTHQDPAAAQDTPDCLVQEKYVQENHVVEKQQSDGLSKIVNGPEVFNPSEDEQVSVTEDDPASKIVHEAPNGVQKVGESDFKTDEVPKRSYASIVKVMKENAIPNSRIPTKVEPKRQEEQAINVPRPTPLSEKSDSGAIVAVNGNDEDNERVIGPSIYLKGLPLDATPALLENEFQKFGLIRTNGIQVRSQKGFCFGFIEFESASSMQSAIEASPIILNGHRVVVEEKRSASRGNNYRGRLKFDVGYRNEGGRRGSGSFRGGYGRNELNGYGNNNNNRGNNRGGYTNRANVDRGGFSRVKGNNERVRNVGIDPPRMSVTA